MVTRLRTGALADPEAALVIPVREDVVMVTDAHLLLTYASAQCAVKFHTLKETDSLKMPGVLYKKKVDSYNPGYLKQKLYDAELLIKVFSINQENSCWQIFNAALYKQK